MKKILALAVALIMAAALSVGVFADDVLYSHDFTDAHPDSWWEDDGTHGVADDAALVEALKADGATLVITTSSETANGQWGFQSTATWKNVLIKTFEDAGDADNKVITGTVDGATVKISGADVLAAADEIGCDLSAFKWINGSGDADTLKVEVIAAAAAAPAEEPAADEPAAEAPAETTTEAPAETTTTAPAETSKAPSTGIALAVVPAVAALAAVAVSKKH